MKVQMRKDGSVKDYASNEEKKERSEEGIR
jgi:hypothetical protein